MHRMPDTIHEKRKENTMDNRDFQNRNVNSTERNAENTNMENNTFPEMRRQDSYDDYNTYQNAGNEYSGNGKIPGQGAATASLVLGIIAVVCWFFQYSSLLSILFGIIGLVLASKSKKAGFNGGTRTAGFVLSLVGLIGGALVFIACVACVGSLAALGSSWS